MTDPLFRKILLILAGLLIIILGFHAFNQVKGMLVLILNILSPFLIALILAYILAPIVVALQKKLKLGRIMGAVILYLLIFGVLFILLTFLIPTVLTELIRLFEMIRQRLPGIINSLSETLNARMDSNAFLMVQNWLEDIEIDFEKIFSSVLPGLKQFATGGMHAMGQTAKGIVSGAGAVIGFFTFIVFVGIIHFYLILDWEKIPPLIQKIVPYKHRDKLFDIMDKMDAAMGGFLRGQLTVSAIVGGDVCTGAFCHCLCRFSDASSLLYSDWNTVRNRRVHPLSGSHHRCDTGHTHYSINRRRCMGHQTHYTDDHTGIVRSDSGHRRHGVTTSNRWKRCRSSSPGGDVGAHYRGTVGHWRNGDCRPGRQCNSCSDPGILLASA